MSATGFPVKSPLKLNAPRNSLARSRLSVHERKLNPALIVWLPFTHVIVLLRSHIGW